MEYQCLPDGLHNRSWLLKYKVSQEVVDGLEGLVDPGKGQHHFISLSVSLQKEFIASNRFLQRSGTAKGTYSVTK